MNKIAINGNMFMASSNNYEELNSKPSINGVELTGDMALREVGIYSIAQIDNMLAGRVKTKVVTELPLVPVENTTYYVGPDEETGGYQIFLYIKDEETGDLIQTALGRTDSFSMDGYQPVTDNTLTTNSKEVPGAINEVNTKFGDIKNIKVVTQEPTTFEENTFYIVVEQS